MTDRDRLIMLYDQFTDTHPSWYAEEFVDYLLANGAIVAPMPMAEWLRQELTEYVYKRCMEEL